MAARTRSTEVVPSTSLRGAHAEGVSIGPKLKTVRATSPPRGREKASASGVNRTIEKASARESPRDLEEATPPPMGLENLPNETILNIMLTVPILELLRNRVVNKLFNEIANDDYFWRLRLEQDYPNVPIPTHLGEDAAPGEPDKITYRDLYFYWYQRPTGESRLIEIPVNVFNPSQFGYNLEDFFSEDNDIKLARIMSSHPELRRFLDAAKIRRGDVIHLEAIPDYRNDGKFIYDGRELLPLDFSLDDYGAVPPSFQVIDEFPIHYWKRTITHNCIIHFNLRPYMNQVLTNLQCRDIDDVSGGIMCKSKFTHWSGVEYTLIIPLDDPVSDQELQRRLETGILSWCDDLEITHSLPEFQLQNYDPATTVFLSSFASLPQYSHPMTENA